MKTLRRFFAPLWDGQSDALFFWLGWLMIGLGPCVTWLTARTPGIRWHGCPREAVMLWVLLAPAIIIGCVVQSAYRHDAWNGAGRVLGAIIGGCGLFTSFLLMGFVPLVLSFLAQSLIANLPNLMLTICAVSILMGFLFAFPIAALWIGYKVGHNGWLWGTVAMLPFWLQINHDRLIDRGIPWYDTAYGFAVVATCGWIGELLAERHGHVGGEHTG